MTRAIDTAIPIIEVTLAVSVLAVVIVLQVVGGLCAVAAGWAGAR